MPVRVKLNDNIEIIVMASTVADVRKALNSALQNVELLTITNRDGHEVVVNPAQVLYLEAVDASTAGSNGATAPARRRRHTAKPA